MHNTTYMSIITTLCGVFHVRMQTNSKSRFAQMSTPLKLTLSLDRQTAAESVRNIHMFLIIPLKKSFAKNS